MGAFRKQKRLGAYEIYENLFRPFRRSVYQGQWNHEAVVDETLSFLAQLDIRVSQKFWKCCGGLLRARACIRITISNAALVNHGELHFVDSSSLTTLTERVVFVPHCPFVMLTTTYFLHVRIKHFPTLCSFKRTGVIL